MTTTLSIKFKGMEESILDGMVDFGLFNTKSEAVRSALVKYAMDLNMIGYDVTISSENGVYESDFELIIRKRPPARRRKRSTARRKHPL